MRPVSLDSESSAALARARQLYRQGHLAEAEAVLTRLTAQGSAPADAWHLLGVIAARRGDAARAIALLRQATQAAPERADLHADLGTGLLQAGRSGEAEAAYRAALQRTPDRPELLANLAVALRQLGREAEAMGALRQALVHQPGFAEAQARLAELLAETGAPAEALTLIRAALVRQPKRADFHLIHGTVLRRLRRFEAAIAALETALSLQPTLHQARLNLGHVALVAGRYEQAAAAYGAVPDGVAETGHARAGLGNALNALGRSDQALAAFAAALALRPGDAGIRHNHALALLAAGRYAEGWRAYEARLARPEYARGLAADAGVARWQGDPPVGRSILVRSEQGLGDTLQFARFVPLLAQRGARVVFQVQPTLVRLLRRLPGVADERLTVIATDRAPPPTELWCPLLSLPGHLGIDLADLPGPVPYLWPDPAARADWRARLAARPELKVGLVWAGNPVVWDDHLRSPGLTALRPLFGHPDVRVYGLQLGPGRADLQLQMLPDSFVDLGGALTDAADTAAVMGALDLVISSCTMTAHLAGGLGVPVWVLLSYAPDWRWLRDRTDSPWYPSARLFRQSRPGDWSGVVQAVQSALGRLVEDAGLRSVAAATDRRPAADARG